MSANLRVFYFRLWRNLSQAEPDKYRIVKMHPDSGTFGIEKKEEENWKLMSYLPPWQIWETETSMST